MPNEKGTNIVSLTFAGQDPGKLKAIITAVEQVLGDSTDFGPAATEMLKPWGQSGGWFRDITHPWSQSGGWMLVIEDKVTKRPDPVSPDAETLRNVRAALAKADPAA